MRSLVIIPVLLLLAGGAYAQDEAARKAAVEVAARVPLERPVKGAPYSADTIVEGLQTLADGNHISRKTTGHVYRDGEGRTRREEERTFTFLSTTGPTSNLMTSVSIVDPVAGFSYSLDAEHKIAWRTPIGVSGAVMQKLEASAVAERRKMELEKQVGEAKNPEDAAKLKAALDEAQRREPTVARARGSIERTGGALGAEPPGPLEHKTLEGVAVEGRKTTTVIPAGAIGNEQPITITSEEWRSPELNVLVLTRHSDPRSGESTYRLTNIIRAEPDHSLFIVPSDYTVKETGIKRNLEENMVRRER
jgi:hypothetical protein